MPVFAALAQTEPATFDEYKNSYVASLKAGISQQEAIAQLRALFMTKVLPIYMRQGRNAPLVAYWKTQVQEMRELRDHDPTSCVRYLYSKGGDATGMVSPTTLKSDLDALAELLLAGKSAVAQPTEDEVMAALRKAVSRAEREMPGSMQLVRDASLSTPTPARTCDATIVFYQSILALPSEEAGPALKYLFSQS